MPVIKALVAIAALLHDWGKATALFQSKLKTNTNFDEAQIGPIAIEPYGAVTNLGKAYRTPKDKADFYTLFDRFALGESLADKAQEHYVMAVLVRGGVFGQSGKD